MPFNQLSEFLRILPTCLSPSASSCPPWDLPQPPGHLLVSVVSALPQVFNSILRFTNLFPLCVQLLPVRSGFRRSPKERIGSSCSWQPIWHHIFKKHKLRHIKLTLSITIHYKKSFLLSLSPEESSQIFLPLRSLIDFHWSILWCYHFQGHHQVKNPGDHYLLVKPEQRWHSAKLPFPLLEATAPHLSSTIRPQDISRFIIPLHFCGHFSHTCQAELSDWNPDIYILPPWKCGSPWQQVVASFISAARFISPCLSES